MKVHHYSERGLVNALVQAISSKDDGSLLPVLFSKVFSVESGMRLSGDFLNLGNPLAVEIFVEPSLSEFGNPDAVIFAKGPKGGPIAVYVEAKLCPFFASSRPEAEVGEAAYRKNASTILHELYMKASLHQEIKSCNELGALSAKVYADESRPRKLGSDPQVLALAKRLQDCEAYFLAVTTDPSCDAVDEWTWGKKVSQFLQKMEGWNHPQAKSTGKHLDFTKPMTFGGAATPKVREQWHKAVVHLSWSDVLWMAKEKRLQDILVAIDENKGKFQFPSLPINPEMAQDLEKVWAMHGLRSSGTRESDRETLYPLKGTRRAFATYALVEGFKGPEVEFYFIHRGRARVPEARITLPWKNLSGCLTAEGRSPELNKVLQEWESR